MIAIFLIVCLTYYGISMLALDDSRDTLERELRDQIDRLTQENDELRGYLTRWLDSK